MTYDKKDIFDSEIQTHLSKLVSLCYEKGLPCFVSVAVSNTESGGTEYISDLVSPGKIGIELNDDHISRHVNVLNGFHTKLPDEPVILDL